MSTCSLIEDIAKKILSENPSEAISHLLHRDVLKLPPDDPEFMLGYEKLIRSCLVTELEVDQWGDGSWGRLHSRDTRSRQKVPTTEWAVERAIRLGLAPSHPSLQRAVDYLVSVLDSGKCHDPPEKNDRWSTGVRLFAASTLAWIEPDHPAIDVTFSLWLEILHWTFQAGRYDPEDEIRAHQALTGASVSGSYLRLNNKYTLKLLGSRSNQIPEDLQNAYLQWVGSISEGLIYLTQALHSPPMVDRSGALERWFRSIEILSDFKSFTNIFEDLFLWFWDIQGSDGFWDFGPRLRSDPTMPLSESWRRRGVRQQDWTTRVLLLLTKVIN